MNKGLVFLAGAVMGAGTAFTGCYVLLKKRFDKELESRIESLKVAYSADFGPKKGVVDDFIKESVENEPVRVEKPEKKEEKSNKINYSEIISKMNNDKPYPISSEEFINSENSQVTYFYFPDDEVFIDITDDIVPEAFDEVGKENLNKFGVHEPGVLYVRNVKNGVDYEVILKEDMTYKEYIGEE